MRSIDIHFSKLLLDIGEEKISSFKIILSRKTDNVCKKISFDINDDQNNTNKVILTTQNDILLNLLVLKRIQ